MQSNFAGNILRNHFADDIEGAYYAVTVIITRDEACTVDNVVDIVQAPLSSATCQGQVDISNLHQRYDSLLCVAHLHVRVIR